MSRLAISIGNTHVKLAIFQDLDQGQAQVKSLGKDLVKTKIQILSQTWLVSHKNLPELIDQLPPEAFEQIAIASVVETLVTPWHSLPQTRLLGLDSIPLQNTYPGLGVDRALTALGAGKIYGFPALIVDLGTAISLTGIGENQTFIGGAILPGMRSQFKSLNQSTAALPLIEIEGEPKFNFERSRWANSTSEAIKSGVIYGIVAALESFMLDWRLIYPDSKILFTGGDSGLICQFLSHFWKGEAIQNQELIFWGISQLW
jgi:type III pantothenate kinase